MGSKYSTGQNQCHEQVMQRGKTALARMVGRWAAGALPVQNDVCSSVFVTPRCPAPAAHTSVPVILDALHSVAN